MGAYDTQASVRHENVWKVYLQLKEEHGAVFSQLPRKYINEKIGDACGYTPRVAGRIVDEMIKKHGDKQHNS